MSPEIHPQMAAALGQIGRFRSALEGEQVRANAASFTGIDAANSVEVTLDWRRWLTGLRIDDGLLGLGAEEVARRINEALGAADANAIATMEADEERLIASLKGIVGELQKSLDSNFDANGNYGQVSPIERADTAVRS